MTPVFLLVVCGPFRENILKNHGNFSDLVRKAITSRGVDVSHVEMRLCHIYDNEALPEDDALGEFDAIIFSGSRYNVTENHDWAQRAQAWLRRNVLPESDRVNVPIFAICYGHQLLCKALGGDVAANPKGQEGGTFTVHRKEGASYEDDVLLRRSGVGDNFNVQAYHNQTVTVLPLTSKVFYTTPKDDHQFVRHAPLVYSTQFHPEFTPELFRDYAPHLSFVNDEAFQEFMASLKDTPHSMSLLATFAQLALENYELKKKKQ